MSAAFVAASLLSYCVAAPGVQVTARVETPDGGLIRVGENFGFVVEARHPPGEVALLPAVLPLPDSLAERSGDRKRTRAREGQDEVDRFRLELLAFEAGTIVVPKIEVAIGSTVSFTPELELEITSNLSADEQLVASTTTAEAAGAAMAELERLSAPDPAARTVLVANLPLLYGLGALAALLALALALKRFWAPPAPKTTPAAPAPPPRPADEVALERLEALARAGHLDRGELKDFYVALSEILRVYVGARYGFDSVELTQLELTEALRRFDTPGLDEDELLRLLQDADLVKFAKFSPPPAEASAAWSRARAIVLATRIRREEEAA